MTATSSSIFIHEPDSSLIERVTYIPSAVGSKPTMTITMKGGKDYTYYDVPADVYHDLTKAKSAGSHFGKHIKGKYRKLGDEDGDGKN